MGQAHVNEAYVLFPESASIQSMEIIELKSFLVEVLGATIGDSWELLGVTKIVVKEGFDACNLRVILLAFFDRCGIRSSPVSPIGRGKGRAQTRMLVGINWKVLHKLAQAKKKQDDSVTVR